MNSYNRAAELRDPENCSLPASITDLQRLNVQPDSPGYILYHSHGNAISI